MASLKSVKIGAVTYDVAFVDNLVTLRDDNTYKSLHGSVNYTSCTIKVESDQDEQVKAATVLHEAIHAILHNAGHDDHDENQVIALGFGLYALLKDNPDLVTWLGIVPEGEKDKVGKQRLPTTQRRTVNGG